jgi:peptidoglycan pentaglycine glycine transferase (the first glycine)
MSSFLQSAEWQQFQEHMGASTLRESGQLFIERSFSFGNYFLSSRCEIGDSFTVAPFKGCCFMRFEPEDTTSLDNLKKLGRLVQTVSVQPHQTLILNLDKSVEELVAEYKSKHRYNLRVAERHELTFEAYSTDLLLHFDRFWKLHADTAHRQDFRTHPAQYYQKMLELLEQKNMVHLLFVKDGDVDLATMLLITHEGVATYLHGGSSETGKEKMAPYLLHTKTMQFAKTLGCTSYDLWGTDAQYDTEKQAWEAKSGAASNGTTRFKLGFGGNIVEYPGCYDLILQPFCYTLYTTLRTIRAHKRAFS